MKKELYMQEMKKKFIKKEFENKNISLSIKIYRNYKYMGGLLSFREIIEK